MSIFSSTSTLKYFVTADVIYKLSVRFYNTLRIISSTVEDTLIVLGIQGTPVPKLTVSVETYTTDRGISVSFPGLHYLTTEKVNIGYGRSEVIKGKVTW